LDPIESHAVNFKRSKLLDRFTGTASTGSSPGGSGFWRERATVTLGYDSLNKLVNVVIENTIPESLLSNVEAEFKLKCAEGSLYQLQIPELDLLASQSACQYAKQGLNETISFFTDAQGSLVSFAYEVIDYSYLANYERSAKRRRLMTTPVWDTFKTEANVVHPEESSRPIFPMGGKEYNSLGGEKKVEVKRNVDGTAAVAPQE